jgi:hypothetical protein
MSTDAGEDATTFAMLRLSGTESNNDLNMMLFSPSRRIATPARGRTFGVQRKEVVTGLLERTSLSEGAYGRLVCMSSNFGVFTGSQLYE